MEQDNVEIQTEKGAEKLLDIKPKGFIPFMEEEIQKDDKVMELQDIFGMIKTLTAAPTYIPTKLSQQIVIAVAGGNNSLYVYDATTHYWRAATLGT